METEGHRQNKNNKDFLWSLKSLLPPKAWRETHGLDASGNQNRPAPKSHSDRRSNEARLMRKCSRRSKRAELRRLSRRVAKWDQSLALSGPTYCKAQDSLRLHPPGEARELKGCLKRTEEKTEKKASKSQSYDL